MRAALPLLLTLAAFALRTYRIDDHNVWYDEGGSVYPARLPLAQMARWTAEDVHPPLYFASVHYWLRLVGESEYALRYGSVLFAVASVAVLFWIARRYLGLTTALAATALLALSRLHVEWSQEIRMYAPGVLLVTVSTALFLRMVVDGDWRARVLIAHAGTSALGLHTLYFFGIAPLVQSALVVLAAVVPIAGPRLPRGFVARWSVAQVGALASFVPWALFTLGQPRPPPTTVFPVDLVTWLRAVFTAYPVGVSAYLDDWIPATVAGVVLAVLPLVLDRRPEHRWPLLAAFASVVSAPFVIHVMSNPNPIFYSPNLFVRYVVLLVPFYCVLAGHGLVELARRSRPVSALAALALCLTSAWTLADLYHGRYRRDEYRTIVSFMRAYERPGDAVVLYSDWDWRVFSYYEGDRMPRYGVGTLAKQTPQTARRSADEWLSRHPGLWLVTLADAYDVDPEGFLRRELEARSRPVADFRLADKRLTLFSSDPARTTAQHVASTPHRAAQLPGVPELIGYDRFVEELTAGERLRLATYWRGPAPAATTYMLEVVGAAGIVKRSTDRLRPDWPAEQWPAGGVVRVDHELSFDPRLPTGRYELRVGRSDGTSASLASIALRPAETPLPTPPSYPPLPARGDLFGGAFELAGAETPASLSPGGDLSVQLLWRAREPVGRPYTAFVQLVGTSPNPQTGNQVWAQIDAPPSPERPTTEWLRGDAAHDVRTLTIPTELPAGRYELIAGLYDPADGTRVRLADGADSVVLARYDLARG